LALAGTWLLEDRFDTCLVVAAEEIDWPVATAWRLFSRSLIPAEGAAAFCLRRASDSAGDVQLAAVTSPRLYRPDRGPARAARELQAELAAQMTPGEILCDGLQGAPGVDRAERDAWRDWCGPRLSPKRWLGEGQTAAVGWQCALAVEALRAGAATAATVCVVGTSEQAIGARFTRLQP
jgi:hypothetical protein